MDKTAENLIVAQTFGETVVWPVRHATDIAWLLLFAALHYFSPVRHAAELQLLLALAVFQVISTRVQWFQTRGGNWLSIGVKLLLGWLLMGVTFGVDSSYYLILLLPVVSAATTLDWRGVLVVTVAAAGAHLSFLLFLGDNYEIPPGDLREIGLRVLFLPIVGVLTYQLAQASREQARRYQLAAEQLAAANLSLREAEDHIRRAERLAALGQLTAGLAHELRNPLGTIKNSAELLSRRLDVNDELAQELTGYISSEADRTNVLITRFLEFARPFRLKQEPQNLAEVIDTAIEKLDRRNPPYPVSVVRNYSPDVRPVPMDRDLMEQVMVNLLSNAAEASPPGGVVTAKTRQADGMAEVVVIDRGSGVAEEHRESIFNPFFTTKASGVGLGLAIVSKIVNEHGGRIAVESTPGEGSIFRVWLPNAS